MTTYVVLLPGDETVWDNATEEERSTMYAKHGEFARLLAERGHAVTAGAELTNSRFAKTIRGNGSGTTVTDGPYAESVEQLGGFYVIDSDDLDDLLAICGVLVDGVGGVEVRTTVDHSS